MIVGDQHADRSRPPRAALDDSRVPRRAPIQAELTREESDAIAHAVQPTPADGPDARERGCGSQPRPASCTTARSACPPPDLSLRPAAPVLSALVTLRARKIASGSAERPRQVSILSSTKEREPAKLRAARSLPQAPGRRAPRAQAAAHRASLRAPARELRARVGRSASGEPVAASRPSRSDAVSVWPTAWPARQSPPLLFLDLPHPMPGRSRRLPRTSSSRRSCSPHVFEARA
jgi:hypothetical protein